MKKLICTKCKKEFDVKKGYRNLCYDCQPSKNEKGQIMYYHKCCKCSKEFYGTNSTQKFCSIECSKEKLKCPICGKEFYSNKVIKENKIINTCSLSCSAKLKMQNKNFKERVCKAGIQNLINYNKSENGKFKSKETIEKYNNSINGKQNTKNLHKNDGIKYCEKCKEYTHYIIGIGCINCHNKSNVMKNSTINRNINNWKNEEYRNKMLNILSKNSINPNWLSLSIQEKIKESEDWLNNPKNKDSSARSYIKQNLQLLKMKENNTYNLVFKDCEKIIKENPSDGYIYAHIDSRDNTIFYIGQTTRDPIKRYAEHQEIRLKCLNGLDPRFDSIDDFISKTGLTWDKFYNTKVIILQQLNKSDCKDEEDFKNTLKFLEQEAIKNYCPKYNFYISE